MITLEQFFNAVNFRISEGSDYGWTCFGPDAYMLCAESTESFSASVVFDRQDQTVFEVDVHDYNLSKSYRLINPDFKEQYFKESKERGIDPFEAYDNVNFIDLELPEDFIEKTSAIVAGEAYDNRVLVPVELSDEDMATVEKLSSEAGLTVEEYLSKLIADNAEDFIAQCQRLAQQNNTAENSFSNSQVVGMELSSAIQRSFDLEQNIQNCWNVVDDINLLCESVLERDLTKDEISNALLGMKTLYQLKFEKAFSDFENIHALLCSLKNQH